MRVVVPYSYKKTDFGETIDPYIPVGLKIDGVWRTANFILDSGADSSVLPLSFAKRLGIQIDKGRLVEIGGIGGQGVDAYPAKVPMKLGSKEMEVSCLFIDNDAVVFLLGRMDIFDELNIMFDGEKGRIVIEDF